MKVLLPQIGQGLEGALVVTQPVFIQSDKSSLALQRNVSHVPKLLIRMNLDFRVMMAF